MRRGPRPEGPAASRAPAPPIIRTGRADEIRGAPEGSQVDTARARAEAALSRDATLEALAFAAQRLLEEPSWERSIDQVLRRLGEAVEVSRAYVIENLERSGTLVTGIRARWLGPGRRQSVAIGEELEYTGFERWVTMLSRGDVVPGPASTFPATERDTLAAHDIRSVLVVPIVVEGDWWGYLGFDDCCEEREWTQVEIDALRAVGGTLASAIIRERSDRQLREAEERFRRIVETTPAITYQEDLTKEYEDAGSVLYMSPQIETILGYTPQEWEQIPGFWTQIMHPDDRDRVVQEAERTGRTGDAYSQEYRMIAADGRVVWFRDQAVQIRDEVGRPLLWQGVMLDITERKEAEARLREAEDVFRALVEHIPAVTYREALHASPEEFYISPRVRRSSATRPRSGRGRRASGASASTRTTSTASSPWTGRRTGPPGLHDRVPVPRRRRVVRVGPRRGDTASARRRRLLAGVHARHHRAQAGRDGRSGRRRSGTGSIVERSPLVIYTQEIDADSRASRTTYISPRTRRVRLHRGRGRR